MTNEKLSAAERKPWAFIAHRDGEWMGVLSAELPKRELHNHLGGYVAKGCTIFTAYNRDEYLAELERLEMYKPGALLTKEQSE